MAGIAPSTENWPRRAKRLAVGVTVALLLSQFIHWKFGYICPLITAILLQDSKAQPFRQILVTMLWVTFLLFSQSLIFLFLSPYPVVFLVYVCLALYWLYRWALESGVHILAIAAGVISLTAIPVVVTIDPITAWKSANGLWLNFLLASLIAKLLFGLFPPRYNGELDGCHDHHGPVGETNAIALTMAVTMMPLVAFVITFSISDLLIPIFAAFFAMELCSVGAYREGRAGVLANMLIAGIGALVFYELIVMFPHPIFLGLFAMCFLLFWGGKIFKMTGSSLYWSSGINGFVVLIGGAMYYEDSDVGISLLKRVVQILMAAMYVWAAFKVADMCRYYWSRYSKQRAFKS
ncbi:hypothetical protein C9J01_13780 [Photobacterium rosenbergii]|uniref:DUF2955 domain-containing protein n=1 Tax=Photobacterium rosenbergii TaxID=294936 RepID=A0A2T3NDH3_9GAMM|nr:DUF2955 domain-containing protein [Photobacterium rosenbergii]PSW12248.1 hypothetical protein C9J01_13780 [Photobacterium rosenbergii]